MSGNFKEHILRTGHGRSKHLRPASACCSCRPQTRECGRPASANRSARTTTAPSLRKCETERSEHVNRSSRARGFQGDHGQIPMWEPAVLHHDAKSAPLPTLQAATSPSLASCPEHMQQSQRMSGGCEPLTADVTKTAPPRPPSSALAKCRPACGCPSRSEGQSGPSSLTEKVQPPGIKGQRKLPVVFPASPRFPKGRRRWRGSSFNTLTWNIKKQKTLRKPSTVF